ncbi:hypothetical protein [Rhizobium lentis]|uniref:hypothetical protein n=1 Tax=Rhizobium lentis TaxID=1138194 RepID=UPI002180C845|nr:hypothetical protein [Rhizobium lentis]
MSASAEWAIMAISVYMREDGRRRVVVPLSVGNALVLDQHAQQACERLGIDRNVSNLSWRFALTAGEEPPSWRTADAARAAGAEGIIDRSRLIPAAGISTCSLERARRSVGRGERRSGRDQIIGGWSEVGFVTWL